MLETQDRVSQKHCKVKIILTAKESAFDVMLALPFNADDDDAAMLLGNSAQFSSV